MNKKALTLMLIGAGILFMPLLWKIVHWALIIGAVALIGGGLWYEIKNAKTS